MRVSVYVDGFNLYGVRLKRQPHLKWLNLKALVTQFLQPHHTLIKIHYYTARVSGKLDVAAPARQQAYLTALESLGLVDIHYGNFLFSEKWAYVIRPPVTKPDGYVWNTPLPDLVWTAKTEEKGSDVNLASHLIRDGFKDLYDLAIVITNDTDLVEPMRIVRWELEKNVLLLTPVPPDGPINPKTGRRPVASRSLVNVANTTLYIHNKHLRLAQFDEYHPLPNGRVLRRPLTWR